jgi:hypothetical protein
MAPYRSPLRVVDKTRRVTEPRSLEDQLQDPADLARLMDLVESVHRFPDEPVEAPGWDRVQRALTHADRIRRRIARNPSSDPSGPSPLVTGPLPTGDDVLATPAPRRHTPEHGAAAGRQGAGVGQHLTVVEPMGQLIDITTRLEARRDPFNNGSAA